MGAIAALKGYRTQFLYSLYRILLDKNNKNRYQLEGCYEDLDILNNTGRYIECLQVKNVNTDLVFSDLFSKKDSFFNRAIKLIQNNPEVKVKVISFGAVSPELQDIDKLRKKIEAKGFSKAESQLIVDHYEVPDIVDEEHLYGCINNYIKNTFKFIDPKITIELLLQWMYYVAEKQEVISTDSISIAIDKIGKYIVDREDFHTQYGRSIVPLQIKTHENEDISLLKDSYYYGASARYEHILANLDVIRDSKLNEIDEAFNSSNIVFIHGASGQGKSTLAYRYLHNYSCDETVYELKLSNDFSDINSTINCLDALCKNLKFKITIYIDVLPSHNLWSNVIKELSTKNNLKFLITIRQENWNSTIIGEDYNFKEIELIFDENEAKIIYDSLSSHKVDLKFASFNESWIQFGQKGLLLEYVYLINQGDTLKFRLKNQVRQLEKEKKCDELEILKYVCLADTYNAKIDYKKLIKHLNLNIGLASSFISELENEYLLKYADNNRYITGLHSIRSQILYDILFVEDDYIEVEDYVNSTINVIDEYDLHLFLLNSFTNNYCTDKLIETLTRSTNISSWTGVMNVFNALLWKGIYDFVFEKNIEQFDTLYEKLKSGWYLGLPYDYSETMGDSLRNLFTNNKPQIIEFFDKVASEFSAKNEIYCHIIKWLINNKNINSIKLIDNNDIYALGTFCFWINHLKLKESVLFEINNTKLLELYSNTASIENLSELILGLKHYEYQNDIVSQLTEKTISLLRKKYSIVYMNVGDEVSCLYIHDIINYDKISKEFEDSKNIFNDMSVRILELLRKLYPFCKKYNAKCIGLNSFNSQKGDLQSYDPTLKHISNTNLPIEHLVQINSLIISLYNYSHRPETWEEYINECRSLRNDYYNLCNSLIELFVKYFKTLKDYSIFMPIEKRIHEITKNGTIIQLPKLISDKWGYAKEADKLTKTYVDSDGNRMLKKDKNKTAPYLDYKKSQENYLSSQYNFFNQLFHNLISVAKIHSSQQVEYNRNLPYVHIKDALIVHDDYTKEGRGRFAKFYDIKKYDQISNDEINNLFTLLFCWRAFENGHAVNSKIRTNAQEELVKVKKEFDIKTNKIHKASFAIYGFPFQVYLGSKMTPNKLILLCNVSQEDYNQSICVAAAMLREYLKSSHFSLKSIIIELNIEDIIYIPLIEGHPISNTGIQFPLYRFTNKDFSDDEVVVGTNPAYSIDSETLNELDLCPWDNELFLIQDYKMILSTMASIVIMINQMLEINLSETDSFGKKIKENYYNSILIKINDIIKDVQPNLNNLKSIIDYKLHEKITHVFNSTNFMTNNEKIEVITTELQESFLAFVYKCIKDNK